MIIELFTVCVIGTPIQTQWTPEQVKLAEVYFEQVYEDVDFIFNINNDKCLKTRGEYFHSSNVALAGAKLTREYDIPHLDIIGLLVPDNEFAGLAHREANVFIVNDNVQGIKDEEASTLFHEIAHIFNNEHVDDINHIMYYSTTPGGKYIEEFTFDNLILEHD